MKKKAEMIRSVVSETYVQTNGEIQRAVYEKYGVFVGHNEIINTLGSYADRQRSGAIDPHLKQKAVELLRAAGDRVHAVRLLHLVEDKR